MVIRETQFNRAVESCGFPTPDEDVYRYFKHYTNDFCRKEAAMFLAQLIHESAGFQYTEEIVYAGRHNHGAYKDRYSLPGRDYHGRGYIQLTWAQNYRDASNDLGMGDELLRNPDRVARETKLAMKVSAWYWRARVRPQMGGRLDRFGLTTRAINGAIECDRGYNEVAANRYRLYLNVAEAVGIPDEEVAEDRGCYN